MSLHRIKLHHGKKLILIKLDVHRAKLVLLIRARIAAVFLVVMHVYL